MRAIQRFGCGAMLAACMGLLGVGCSEEPDFDEGDVLDDEELPPIAAVCLHPDSLRVVTANIAHLSINDLMVEPAASGISKLEFLWEQTVYLNTLEGFHGNVLNLQEVTNNRSTTENEDWPFEIDESFGRQIPGIPCTGYRNYYSPAHHYGSGQSYGNAIVSSVIATEHQTWDLTSGPDNNGRSASVAHLDEGAIDLWVVDAHLQFCIDGDMSENRNNLNRLLSRLDGLDPEAAVLVSGDFNIHQYGPTDHPCAGPDVHPPEFVNLLRQFRQRGFVRLETAGVDHVFLRDPKFQLAGQHSEILVPNHVIDGEQFKMSDHRFIVTDLDIEGPGMSPSLLPLFESVF